MAYKRISKAIQSFKSYYLQEIEVIDTIYMKDVMFLVGCILMLVLSFMFIILLWEIFLWIK
mgnify:CR=1 FL=1